MIQMITIGSIVMSIGVVPSAIAFFYSLKGQLTSHYPYFRYLTYSWISLTLSTAFLALSYFTLNFTLYKIGILLSIPLLLSIVVLTDSISRPRVDAIKLFVATIISTLLVVFSFDTDAVKLNTSKLGELSPALNGRFEIATTLVSITSALLWLYSMFKIYISSPPKLKKMAFLNLAGGIIAGPVASLVFALGLVWYFPGLDYVFIGIGAVFTTLAMYNEPKLGYVLRTNVYGLVVFNLNSGLPLFTHMWEIDEDFNETLFTGAFSGVSAILNESLNMGIVKRIYFEKGALVVHKIEGCSIGFSVLTSEHMEILYYALELFSKKFIDMFKKEISELNPNMEVYMKAETLVEEAFPFII